MILYYLLVFVMPLTNNRIWGRFFGSLTATKYLGAACLIYAVVHVLARRRLPDAFQSWPARLFILFYLVTVLSYFTQTLPSTVWELSPFLSYTSYLLFLLGTLSVVDTHRRLRWVLLVVIASGAFASLYVLREWQEYHNLIRDFRPGWVMGDANYYTLSTLPCILLGLCLLRGLESSWEKAFCVGCLALNLCGVMLAASRGGFLGLAAAFLIVMWRSGDRMRNFLLVGVLVIPMALFLPASPLHRLVHPDYSDEEAVDNRTTVWHAGLKMIAAHPITGVGLANFKPEVRGYEDKGEHVDTIAHNTYIEVGAELGLPALFIFLSLFFFAWRILAQTQRSALFTGDSLVRQAAVGLEASLVGVAVSIFFVSGEYQRSPWLVVFLSLCLPSLVPDWGRNESQVESVGQSNSEFSVAGNFRPLWRETLGGS